MTCFSIQKKQKSHREQTVFPMALFFLFSHSKADYCSAIARFLNSQVAADLSVPAHS